MPVTSAADQTLAALFALATACTNALAVTTQHVAITHRDAPESKWRLALYLVRQPLWMLGWVALVGSLIFQALALHFGPVSEVQPLLVSELILALVLRRLWTRQAVRPLAWFGAFLVVLGLASFLLASSPRGVANTPSTAHWIAPVLATLALAGALVLRARNGSALRRAALFGAATGVLWALEATFIKATTNTLVASGVSGALRTWPLYALIVGGILGIACEQVALHAGPLHISQPLLVIIDPLVSVLLGAWLFSERFRGGVGHVFIATIGFVIVCVGVVVSTQFAPPPFHNEPLDA